MSDHNRNVVEDDADLISDTTSNTTVVNTDVHGPNQRDNRVWSAPEKAYESFTTLAVSHERDQAAFDADREQERRHTEALHQQAMRHAEELFQQRTRQQDDLHVVTVQALSGSQVADQALADAIAAATVNALVAAGITSK